MLILANTLINQWTKRYLVHSLFLGGPILGSLGQHSAYFHLLTYPYEQGRSEMN